MNPKKKKTIRRRELLKTKVIPVRATPTQKRDIESMADAVGMTTSEFMLDTAYHSGANIPKTDPLVLQQLIKIGNHLNQIARTCYASAKDDQTIDLLQVLVCLNENKKLLGSYAL